MVRRLLLAILLLLPLNAWGADADLYHDVRIAVFAKTAYTHICTSGTVAYVRKQTDGDLHFKITDGPVFIIAEEQPDLKAKGTRPKKGQKITVCGVQRYDRMHKWQELHPVREWR